MILVNSISETADGCKLGSYSTRIAYFADDMIIMAPTSSALQQLVQKTCNGLRVHSLKINFDKSKYIVFRKSQKVDLIDEIEVNGSAIKRVNQIKYLGLKLTDISSLASDVDRCCNSFLRQFYGMYYKFKFLEKNVLQFLFIKNCMLLHGIDKLERQKQFKRTSVTCHKAIKQICGMKVWHSNHVKCDNLNLETFKHFLAKRCYNFFCSFLPSESRCLRGIYSVISK